MTERRSGRLGAWMPILDRAASTNEPGSVIRIGASLDQLRTDIVAAQNAIVTSQAEYDRHVTRLRALQQQLVEAAEPLMVDPYPLTAGKGEQ